MASFEVSYFLFSAIIVVVALAPNSCKANEIYLYVKPLEESNCFMNASGNLGVYQECKTLDGYAESKLLNTSDDTYNIAHMIFLPGVHELTLELHVENWITFKMVACLGDQHTSGNNTVDIQLCSANMKFKMIRSFLLANMTITGICGNRNSLIMENIPWYDVQVTENETFGIEITTVHLIQSFMKFMCENCTGKLIIRDTNLTVSSADFDMKISNNMTLVVENVGLELGNNQSGLTFTTLQVKSITIDNITTLDSTSNMHDITPTYDLLFSSNVNKRTKVTITNSRLDRSKSTGLKINVTTPFSGSQFIITICNTSVSNHIYGGIVIDQTSKSVGAFNLSLVDSVIEQNQIGTITENNCFASGLSVHSEMSNTTHIYIANTTFNNNRDERIHPVTVYITRAHKLVIRDSDFTNNLGTAIQVNSVNDECVSERFVFKGTVNFIGNRADQGGALSLQSAMMHIKPFTYLTFENNTATDVGGAIFVSSNTPYNDLTDPDTQVGCFYQFPNWKNNTHNYSITFRGNKASNGGHDIYGAPIKSYCTVCQTDVTRSFDTDILDLFHFSNGGDLSSVSSNPTRVCVVDSDKETMSSDSLSSACTNLSRIFNNTREVYFGEMFDVNMQIVGMEFGTGLGTVYAQLLPDNVNIYPTHNYSQLIDKISDSNFRLYYTVNVTDPETEKVDLVLSTSRESSKPLDEFYSVLEKDIDKYKESGVISTNLLTTPVFISIKFKQKCPAGFAMRLNSSGDCQEPYCGCHCNQGLDKKLVQCSISNGQGLFKTSQPMWISLNSTEGFIYFHEYCPFDYCNVTNNWINIEDNRNEQCAKNRRNMLCGECVNSYSLAIGSNKCMKCENNNNIALVVFFVAAGFMLVFFIGILNMTVAKGTINGLIFYANIVWAYESILFPSGTDCTKPDLDLPLFSFLRAFLAWLNLDFGIEMCFAVGLDAYTKTWLQFVFPFYTWSIVGLVSVLARWSTRISALVGENIVEVLATVIFLSYAKILRTTMIALMPASIQVLDETGKKENTLKVWAYDGNLAYFDEDCRHVFLLIFSVFVLIIFWLPYTSVLLCIQPLRIASRYNRCLNWLVNNKMKPFLDANIGELRDQNHFWVGLLLLVRCVFFIVLLATYPVNPQASEISLVIIVALLFLLLYHTGHLYNKPQGHRRYCCYHKKFLPRGISFLTILEVSFLLNLLVLGAVRLYADFRDTAEKDKVMEGILIYTSVGIVFVQFLGIVCYHLILKIRIWCYKRHYNNLNNNNNGGVENPISNNQVTVTDIETPSDNNSYRESILGETEPENDTQSDE